MGGLTGGLTGGQPAVDATAAAIAQHNQQQLLQLTNSPYGDSPLFRNLRQVMMQLLLSVLLAWDNLFVEFVKLCKIHLFIFVHCIVLFKHFLLNFLHCYMYC